LQIFSIFNFNIDIAGPECLDLDVEFDYQQKWWLTVLLPVVVGGLLCLIFFGIILMKCIKKTCRFSTKTVKYCSHGPRLLATYLLVLYCLYLSVVRRALDVFNCNPTDPPDGYLYTEFVSKYCPAGICKCDDPSELQYKLRIPAIIVLLSFAVGFPAYVFYLTWFFRGQMKMDQLLRAHGLGETRDTAVDNAAEVVTTRKRCCRSTSKRTYKLRKKYNMLYYHFKPGKVYWMFVILVRKFLVAMCALMFRANVGFMLSIMLLILFGNYVLVIKHRPFMSSMERHRVIVEHTKKALEAEEMINRGTLSTEISGDAMLHMEIRNAIHRLKDEIREKDRVQQRGTNNKHRVVKSLDGLKNSRGEDVALKERDQKYYFDYNTLDQVLIACSIFLCVIGLMFESNQFYAVDKNPLSNTTGMIILNEDSAFYYTTVMIFASLILFGSLLYYATVFITEVWGWAPKWLRKCCATKQSRHEKNAAKLSMFNLMKKDEGDIEMHSNPVGAGAGIGDDISGARKKEQDAQKEAMKLAQELEHLEGTQGQMNEEYRRLKAQAARGQLEKNNRTPKNRNKRTRQKKRVFDPRHVNDDGDGDDIPAVALQSSAKETKSNLPDGWEELFDEAEGQAYYFNEATGETVWDIEEALKLNE
jgi:hypothetical protein